MTSELFVWRTTPTRIFAIQELCEVGITCDDLDRGHLHTVQVAAGSSVVIIALWPLVDTPAMVALTCLAVMLPVLAVAADRRLRPRLWTLHAGYRGGEAVLYTSTEMRVFNQVTRALRRSIEDLPPHDDAWTDKAA